jgi:hypothetical protein
MTQQIIDIGIQGNDGTGDSIRESFNKVNTNFSELYAVFGLGGNIKFSLLSDAPGSNSYSITSASSNGTQVTLNFANPNTGLGLPFTTNQNIVVSGLVPAGYNGTYTVTSSSATSVTFLSSTTGALTKTGTISGTAYSANQIIMGSTTGTSLTARNIVGTAGITVDVSGNDQIVIGSQLAGLISDPQPSLGAPVNANLLTIGRLSDPSEDLVATFNAVYASQGITTTIGQMPVTVNYANNNYLQAVNGQVSGALKVRAEPSIPQVDDVDYDPTLSGNYVATEAVQRQHVVLRDGDSMTGALTLSDHPSPLSGAGVVNGSDDLQAATKYYVDNNTYYSEVNLYVSTTSGDDTQKNTPAGREGRAWHYAFKTIGAAALHAENLINLAFTEPGPYRQTLSYTVGPNQYNSVIQGISFTGGNSGIQGYQDAATLLEANKGFIQAETIAYINQKYVNAFTFDQVRYTNIMENIVNGVAYDLVLGTNFNSITQGSILLNNYNSDVSGNLTTILAAIENAKLQLTEYSFSPDNLKTYIGKVITAVSYDLLFGSNYGGLQVGLAFDQYATGLSKESTTVYSSVLGTSGTATGTACAINGTTLTVSGTVRGVWAVGMTVTGLGVTPGTVITGLGSANGGAGTYIVNNSQSVPQTSISGTNNTVLLASTNSMFVGNPIKFTGTNFGNIVVGTTYYITSVNSSLNSITISTTANGANLGLTTATGNLEASTVAPSQIAAVLTNLANNIVALSDVSASPSAVTSIKNIINTISTVITSGATSSVIVPGATIPKPTFPAINGTTTGQISAATLLLENIPFIQAEITAWLLANYPTVTYNQTYSKRDIEFIVWSLVYDLMYGGNSQSTYAGVQYWINGTLQLLSFEQAACAGAIGYINTLAQAIINNNAPAIVYQTAVIQYANTSYSNGNVASSSISANISTIQSIVSATSAPSPSFVAPTTTTVSTTLQHIVGGTICSGQGDSNSINYAANITVFKNNAVSYTNNNFPILNDPTQQSTINTLFNDIENLLTEGISSRTTPTFTNPTGLDNSSIQAKAAILSNLKFITSEVNAYITSNYPSLSYNTAHSILDLTYVLEAICYDLTYGGNFATTQAANNYVINGVNVLTTSTELADCLDGLSHALDVTLAVTSNSVVTPSSGNYITVTGSSGSGTVATLTFATQSVAPFSVNQVINVQGMTPQGYNGFHTVTYCDTTTVRFSSSTIGNLLVAGKITSQAGNVAWVAGAGQSSTIRTLFGVVTGVISSSTLATPTYPTISGTIYDNSLITTYNVITNSSYTISTNVVGYLATTFKGGYSYNEALCYRDIGTVINSQIMDLISDGTYQSILSGKSFYKNTSAQRVFKTTPSLDGLLFAQQLANQVLTQTTQNRYQTLVTQQTNATLGGSYDATVGTNTASASYVSNTSTTLNLTSVAGVIVPGMVITGTGFTNTTPVTVTAVNSLSQVTISAAPAGTPSGTLQFTATAITTFNANFNTIINIIKGGVGAAPAPSYGTGYYTVTFGNGGNGYVDQGEPLDTHILPAMVMLGNSGDAYGNIISYTPGVAVSYDTITFNMSRPQSFFQFVPTTASGSVGSYTITVAHTSYTTYFLGTCNIIQGMGVVGTGFSLGTVVTNVVGNVITLSKPLTSTISVSNVTFGESLDFGATVSDTNVTIFVESGVYQEDYPIRVPANCTINGDDFRRTIIRPLDRVSQSPWRKIFFNRQAVWDGLQTGLIDFSTDFATLANTTLTLSGTTGEISVTLGSGSAQPTWVGLIITDATSETGVAGKAVINTISGNIMNCTVIYPFASITTYATGNWHMYDTVKYGRHYLTNPLDITSTPKNNKDIDVFLVNDATRLRQITCQGHGGFMMVLDPEGQVKTKSPYAQEAASFSASNNKQRFAGGQLIDGFAGRLYGTITSIADSGVTITVQGSTNSGLDVRPPQTPTAFYVQGFRYQVDNVVSYNQSTATAVLTLNTNTPFLPTSSYDNTTLNTNLTSILRALKYDMAINSVATMSTSSITGSTLTVGTVSGTIFPGMLLLDTGGLIPMGTYVVAQTSSGSGSGSTWSINTSVSVSSTTITGTYYSNYDTIKNGIYYSFSQRAVSGFAQEILTQSISYLGEQLGALSLNAMNEQAIDNNVSLINNIIQNAIVDNSTQLSIIPTPQYPIPNGSTYTSDNYLSARILQANRTFIQNEISAYIANYTNVSALTGYSALKSQRDIGYIIDAITHDMLYGGNSASWDVALTYWVDGVSVLGSISTISTCNAAFARLAYIIPSIISNTTINPSVGNTVKQVTNIQTPVSPSTYSSTLASLVTNIISYYVSNGVFQGGYNTKTYATITGYSNTSADVTTVTNAESTILSNTVTYADNGAGIVINIETAGNRSMLANDFTQVNDLGYGIVSANAALTEQVSTFTYYNYTGFWALNGAQVRAVASSNTFGTYGLRATGSDITELPDAVNIANNMMQSARVYNEGAFKGTMIPTVNKQALNVYIIGWEYVPFNTSELEIDHTLAGGGITRYEISTISHTSVNINGQNVLQLTLSTTGSSGTSTTGLAYPLYDGQVVTIRALQNILWYNVDNVKPVRPSTALQYENNLSAIYRVIAYNLVQATGEQLPAHQAILQTDESFQYYKFTVDTTNMYNADPTVTSATGTVVLGGTGTYSLTVNNVSGTTVSFTGTFSGSTLTVTAVSSGTITTGMVITGTSITSGTYITANVSGSQYASGGGTSTWTLNQSATGTPTGGGPIAVGQIIGGYGWSGQTVTAASGTLGGNWYLTVSAYPTITPIGTVYFSKYTQGATLGDNKIAVLQISDSSTISQINSGTYLFAWNGRTHRIIQYVQPTSVATGTYYSYSAPSGVYTLVVQGVAGTISVGQLVSGTGFPENPAITVTGVTTITLPGTSNVQSTVILSDAPTSPSGTITFGGANTNGYLQVDPNPVANIGSSGTGINAMTQVSYASNPGSASGKLITFNIPYNNLLQYPPVDSFITVSGNSNTKYNGSYQINNITNTTQLTVTTNTNSLQVGMVVTTSTTGAFIPSTSTNPSGITIIQSIDSTSQFTVSPACWIPSGATLNCQLIATVASITITNAGTGYVSAPIITFSGGGAITQALATCTIVNGSINTVTLVSPGYGYTSVPTITLSGNAGSALSSVSGTNFITLNSTQNLTLYTAIQFGGPSFDSAITTGQTYYISAISGNAIQISASYQGSTLSLNGGSGSSMTWSTPGNGVLTAVLTATPQSIVVASSGTNSLQMTLAYPTDPGTSGTVTATTNATATMSTTTISSSGLLTVGTVSGTIASGMVLTGSKIAQIGSYSITGVSSSGTTATLTFATTTTTNFAVGQYITVAGITPTGYNGTYIVTAANATTVQYTTVGSNLGSSGFVSGAGSVTSSVYTYISGYVSGSGNGSTWQTATSMGTNFAVTSTTIIGTNNVVTLSSTSNLNVGDQITFSGTTFGNISTSATYYITEVLSGTANISISAVNPEVALTLSNATPAVTPLNFYSPAYGLGSTETILSAGTPTLVGGVGSYAAYYSVVFTINTVSTAPSTGYYYYVGGNTNSLYNGYFYCAASSTSSVTLYYPFNPGTFGTTTLTTVTQEVTVGSSSSLGISKPFNPSIQTTLRIGYPQNGAGQITQNISTCRATGHDFYQIGTGGYVTSNYPTVTWGNPAINPQSANQIKEETVGRVFYVSTDENGIFNVGRFFRVDQGTGTVTFAASIALSNLDGLGFKKGVVVAEFSTDPAMTENGSDVVPVQSAVRKFVDYRLGLDYSGNAVATNSLIGPGFLALNGVLPMKGNLNMASFSIGNLSMPTGLAASAYDGVNRDYVDTNITAVNTLYKLNDVNIGATGVYGGFGVSGGGSPIYTLTLTNVYGSIQPGMVVTGTGFTGGQTVLTVNLVAGTPATGASGTVTISATYNTTPSGILSFKSATNGNFLVYDTTLSQWTNVPGPTGTSNGNQVSISYTHSSTSPGYLTATIQSGVIVNSMVSSSAAIAQSKLNLQAAGTLSSAPVTFTQSSLGLAAFSDQEFTTSNGYVSLAVASGTVTGVGLPNIQQISTGYILGNRSGVNASPGLITPAQVVNDGGGLLGSQFTYSTGSPAVPTSITNGLMTVSYNSVSGPGANQYSITPTTVNGSASSLVKTGSDGSITTPQLNIGTSKTINLGNSTTVSFYTPGGFNYMNSSDITGGHLTTINGTLNAAGTLFATNIQTGDSVSATGSITGQWSLGSLSSFNASSGTFISNNLTAGTSTTVGALTGNWQVSSGSTIDTTSGTLKAGTLTTNTSVIASVSVIGSQGQLSVTAGTYLIGQAISVSGTNTGNATGITTGTTYYIMAVSSSTGIQITDTYYHAVTGVANLTTSGLTTNGLVFTLYGNINVGTNYGLDVRSGVLYSNSLNTGSASGIGAITGTWNISSNSQLQATYADLAEFYEGDQEYEPGTVLVFGGDKEVTTTTQINDTRSAGVVTTNPAYVMNSEQTGIRVCIALAGRVPVKVVGRVKKGDMLTTSATPGYAVKALTPTLGAVIGKALEDKDYGEAGVIQVAVGRV